MSAPPLDDPPAMPTMVSRLPKFGSRPKSAAPSSGAQTDPAATASSGTFTSAAATSSTRLTNGFYHHPGPAGGNGSLTAPPASVKQNGFIRVPTAFSMKWRKENGTVEDGGSDGEREWRRGKGGNVGQNRSGSNVHQYYSQQGSPVVSQRDAKKPTTSSAGKGRGFGLPVTSSSSPSPQSSPRTLPVSKSGSYGSKPSQTAFGLISSTKQTLNGLSGSKPRSGTNGFLRQPHSFARCGGSRPGSGPGSRSGSPLEKKPPAGRSLSSDSLGSGPSVQLTDRDRFRSRSLTQVRQQPSPPLTPSSVSSSSLSLNPTGSYSTNRSAGRGLKELTAPSSAQAPPRGSSAKSPVTSQTPEGGVKSSAAPGRSGLRVPSLLPPSALKKPLLPAVGPASKPSGISYKLSRPSLIKQSRPVRVTPANDPGGDPEVNLALTARRHSVETPSTTDNSPESTPEAPETGGLSAEPASQVEVSIVGETLEDMSLSSTSSLERNDTSQEYMDDFDNLGNGGEGILLLSSKNDEDDSGLDQSCARFDDDQVAVRGVSKAAGLCFLDDGMDWAAMRLGGERGGEHQLTQLSRRRRSSQPDYHDQGGSSLDLSPSDSCGSGGTYMWDEEGLEPLGVAATTASINTNSNTTHHIGSFDSDINSIDILNNLDSCDLDDDDLMLDADLPEDASLHSDGDGITHMAQWRMRQLCWGTQDIHNDNESVFQCYKLTEDPGNKRTDTTGDSDLILDLCPPRSPGLSPGTPGLGLDVEELAEDCSAVRSQLEYLQRLLLQEEEVDDDTLTTDTLSPETHDSYHSSDTQVQTLLQEVQQLREELRSRDRTIAQLTLQLTVPAVTTRCRCQEATGRMDRHTQTSVTERESVASQTPWTEHTSQILHSSSQDDPLPLTDRCPDLPPANACSTPADSAPDCPDTNATDPVTDGGKDHGKRAAKEEEEKEKSKERKGLYNRSLQLPQASKLRLFLSQTSRLASSSASAAATPPRTRAAKQPSQDPESNGTSGVKIRMPAFACSSSRLPKPKSH
ncbi:serine-rich coiled-coil domain-containing protein 2-like isoform X1 [Micropterus dolomieu]|uniref:serine-rich coiled-coil domain-containing protein 2-like isoform X1 n=1 Tax=Micropterus dolomieu TaxID=147949 RepID=UPI001E8E209F|nr:serine-rich coiled-coil domain-containing protein 2-like isoform X1 [Micropterus dolomieu]